MRSTIPSTAEIRAALETLGHSQVQELSRVSGVPFTTLWKVRDGTTVNPGLETVAKFIKFLPELSGAPYTGPERRSEKLRG